MKKDLAPTNFDTLIYEFRGMKVLLDYDLAYLYGVETKRLKEMVRRNIKRFPSDFMFELDSKEFASLRTQIASSNRGGRRYAPMAFTEHGVSMLSSVLNSDRAIQINIEIMRAFSKYRFLLADHKELKSDIDKLDQKINAVFKFLLGKIDALREKKNEPRKKIGY